MNLDREQVRREKLQPVASSRNPLQFMPVLYAQAIFRPVERTFARAAEYARWGLVWFQLLLLLLIPMLLGLLRNAFRDTSTGVNAHANIFFGILDILTVGATIVALIFKVITVPLLFFIGVTLQYLLARALGGRGRYVAHGFDMLLYQVPLAFIGGVIITVFVALHLSTLFFAPIISLALFCYGIFINISVVMGVHHLNREKAIAAVIIPYIIGALAICGLLFLLARYITNAVVH